MALPSLQERLSSFRALLTKHKVDCFIASTNDAHQSEYVCSRDKRLGFLSGFTGSAGTVVVTQKEALLWTDGRYFIAADKQLTDEWTLMKMGLPDTPSVAKWIASNEALSAVAMDPLLTSISYFKKLQKELDPKRQRVVLLTENPIDSVWADHQPPMPTQKVFVHDLKYAGQSTEDKLKAIQSKIVEHGVGALVVTALDHIAWTLNLRGNDIVYNPVFFSYLIVTEKEATLYVDPSKLDGEEQKGDGDEAQSVRDHLKGVGIRKYSEFLGDLEAMVEGDAAVKIWYDPRKCNVAIYKKIPKALRFEKDDCIEIMKSLKNEAEIKGFMDCHVRDGAAKSRFFAWVDALRAAGSGELEKHTEWTFAEKLLSFRKEADLFVDLSFETISSIAGNGAVIHYSPSAEDNAAIKANEVYLLDSGGQYMDGTTDTTRTKWLGTNGTAPSEHRRECYTRVLKGVIALTKMVFPFNTKGPLIDSVARSFLWQIGLDYRHGTGHGVGSFLNVHEGPQGFSASSRNKTLFEYGLRTNMVITNEPGYYEADNFGCRIENVMICVEAETKHQFGGQKFCTFKTATMVPIDKEMLFMEIMSKEEIAWLDEYHQEVYKQILPLMKTQEEKDWLKAATDPVTV